MAFNTPIVDNEIPSAAKWNTAVGVYDVSMTEVNVVSSSAETSLWSKSIGAGHMSTNRALRLTLGGDYLNNTGSSQTLVWRIKGGGSTLFQATATGVNSATRQPLGLIVTLQSVNSASVQFMFGEVTMLGTPGTAVGLLGNAAQAFSSDGTHAIATSSAWTFEVTVQHGASSASLSAKKRFVMLELL